MIPKYVIFSSNTNKMYYDFWEINSKIVKYKLNLIPVLFLITDEDSDFFDDGNGLVKKIKNIGIDTGFQSQIARMYGTQFFKDDVCIISDIDMFMFSGKYFVDDLIGYNDTDFIVMSSDAYGETPRYPMCYNIAKGNTFKDMLNLPINFGDFCNMVLQTNKGWDSDEYYLYSCLVDKRHIKLNRGWYCGRAVNRIDRSHWTYDINIINSYIDCHSLRPIGDYKNEIKKLLYDQGIDISIS